ncbi:MAG: rod shape-determining protein MreC [Candidatus Faecousia sp.]|uniref:rod shape-determining protein MreC n=1 Tax=Faecousia sp. TaxID=2952921 RepID=UPI002A854957|nr:rod shape-determining protein MreC [Candidatus Faecousia sp.]
MKKLFTGRVKTILGFALALAILTGIISSMFGAAWPSRVVRTVITPIRSAISAVSRQVERYYNFQFSYESLEARNDYLQKRLTQMEDDVRTADALERENKRLRELCNLRDEHADYVFDDAYIVSWDSSSWKNAFTIAKGTGDGLAEGMAVVTEYGQVVGLITEIGSNWATVTTVLDNSLEISACVASSGNTGVVQGAYTYGYPNKLRLNYLPAETILRNNDQVVTTGSSLYPKGLILGYIEDAGMDETGVAKYAIVQPAADFDTLEQVFIVTNYQQD